MLLSPPSAFALLRPPRNLASQFEMMTRVASPDYPSDQTDRRIYYAR
ncbi:hypothetical protein FOXYSP1_16906 [Fusarium oxysporum f. sp. phaseoli]